MSAEVSKIRLSSKNSSDRGKKSLRLWLRMLSCESLVEQDIRTKLRKIYAITLPQFDVMAELEYANTALTMTELSNKLMVSNGNITGVIDRLVREGYVKRVPSSDDRRVQLIQLTGNGLKTFKVIAMEHENWITDVFEFLSLSDMEQLTSILTSAHESLKKL